uniref:Uncharacterized protein n=1 Tax=Rhizophora mucronata TaxID=61149 RepID=A0A2P2N7R1_RHIMU
MDYLLDQLLHDVFLFDKLIRTVIVDTT